MYCVLFMRTQNRHKLSNVGKPPESLKVQVCGRYVCGFVAETAETLL